MLFHWGFLFMKKFLIIQTAFIGDVILATAIVEKLKLFYPHSEIYFLLRKGNELLLKNNPHIKKVFVWNKKENKYGHLISIIKEVRKLNITHLINPHRYFSSGIFSVFSGAKETIGFNKNPLSFCFDKKIEHEFGTKEKPIHEVERNLLLIEHLTDPSFVKPKLYPSEKDFNKIKINEPYITISPGSVWFTKQWPKEKWVGFIDKINLKIKVFLIGGKSEIPLCKKIKSLSINNNVEIVAGQLSFMESAALMKKAKMNYVNDSAPLHICSAVNAPVTALFCSTVPSFGFTPLSDNSHVLETNIKLDCRPCGLHGKRACPKGHFKCAEIGIDRLLDKLNARIPC